MAFYVSLVVTEGGHKLMFTRDSPWHGEGLVACTQVEEGNWEWLKQQCMFKNESNSAITELVEKMVFAAQREQRADDHIFERLVKE